MIKRLRLGTKSDEAIREEKAESPPPTQSAIILPRYRPPVYVGDSILPPIVLCARSTAHGISILAMLIWRAVVVYFTAFRDILDGLDMLQEKMSCRSIGLPGEKLRLLLLLP